MKSYFTVVSSKVLKLNSKYQVSITSHGYDKPEDLEVSINKHGEEESSSENRKIVKLTGDETQIVDFDLRDQIVGDYFLSAKSLDGEKFEKRVNLNLNFKKFAVYVQTDKSMYKPSDKVQFRVLLLDADTKPYKPSNVSIFITDGAENRVKQFLDPKFTKGVFQNELQLSDSPVMGHWMIHVKVDGGDDEIKSFEVAEYVLPKFEVVVDTIPNVTLSDGKIRAKVYGKYTYGKLAKGKAKVTAKVRQSFGIFYCGGSRPSSETLVVKTIDVDGKQDVDFDIKDELNIKEIHHSQEVEIKATFTEELTGREHEGSSNVTIYKDGYVIELTKSNEKIKPGLPWSLTAVVKTVSEKPVISDDKNPVEFKIAYIMQPKEIKTNQSETPQLVMRPGVCGINPEQFFHREETERTVEKVLIKDGSAVLSLEIPENSIEVQIEAHYLGAVQHLWRTEKAASESNQFLQITPSTKSPKVNEEVAINVQATEEITKLTYQLLSRCNVIKSETLTVPSSKKFSFKFLPTPEMSPKAKLIVYYVRPDGEIISDQTQIETGLKLRNKMSLKLSNEQSKPGEMIDLTVNSNPDSFIGLLGVDQSVLLMKSGNDIYESTVVENLEQFCYSNHWNSVYDRDEHRLIYTDFLTSEAVIITNAKEEYRPPVLRMPRCAMMKCAAPMAMMERGMEMEADSMPSNALFGGAAAPVAYSAVSAPKPPKIRKKFPETWIFDTLDLTDGKSVLTKKVPDTITSWIITGFSIDPATGLGFTEAPTKLNVFQPFFVSTNLPYSIKRGESVAIPILVFNYLEDDQNVEVTLFNTDSEFEFKEDQNDQKDKMTKTLEVKSNSGSTISFMIKPIKAGNIRIKATATSGVAGDGLEQILIVEPEGITKHKNKALFVDLRDSNELKSEISIEIPENSVPDSTKIEVSAIGDILGPTIDNLDKLIQIPYGCGEQNMLNFVPNIIVLEYLTNLCKLTPEIEMKAKKFMEIGYQRELTYKHHDGSYSAFGKSDRSGSTWLTAFVAKSFNQASKYIQVDKEIVGTALNFLKTVQNEDGSFKEVGTVFHTDMQGGSSKGLGLTAYVLTTFLENQNEAQKNQSTIQKALKYISANISGLEDNYSLAIVSHALQVAKHSMKDSLMQKLISKAENENGLTFWKKSSEDVEEDKNFWNYQPNAINIEMTAYALQALIEADQVLDGVSSMRWLVGQRNKNGGFQSTQDTIVGLQALSKLATKIYVPDSQVDILVKEIEGNETKLNVNHENALILQKHQLPEQARNFEVSASGRGFCLLQFSYKFNISDNEIGPKFVLEPKVNESLNENVLDLTVSTSYIADTNSQKSNMAVMEVSFPSGFVFDSNHLQVLASMKKVKKVEMKDGETVVVVYFYDIDVEKFSLDFKATRSHKVADLKPASVLIYDYYDNARKASTFYSIV